LIFIQILDGTIQTWEQLQSNQIIAVSFIVGFCLHFEYK